MYIFKVKGHACLPLAHIDGDICLDMDTEVDVCVDPDVDLDEDANGIWI